MNNLDKIPPYMLPTLLASVPIAFIAVHWAFYKLLQIAKEKNLVDNPEARKLQKVPVPVVGGIAVYFGVLAGVLAGTAVMMQAGSGPSAMLLPLMVTMTLMLYIGAMDDMLNLSPQIRLLFQIVAVLALIYSSGRCVDSFHGLWGIGAFSWWWGVPLTVLAGVGIINAVNMIDGVNGLSSGMCIICCSLFGVAFVWVGDVAAAMVAFSMVAAQIPFLLHNVFGIRSRMFIGDAGTMIMGVLQSWFVICMLRSDGPGAALAQYGESNMIALSLAVLSVPVFDTLRVMFTRMFQGHSPFNPDRSHLHHVFVDAGVSHGITTLCEVVINVIIMCIWALAIVCEANLDMQLYLVVAASVLLVWGTFFLLRRSKQHPSPFVRWLIRLGDTAHDHHHWWEKLQEWLDAPSKE
ncbi:MAG: undecaprenyl/decaprenyl-phosphate alpha-N-acetylglucosaminyl 1-phosphate transferase [Bacteroidaceae bacterium]|nr:undecaprenyl/decaprenyl-phosphate alpha-N-acetylglucosaminyl 1-phosphate transferase [Bacteroidaceae bacterium]